MRTSFRRSHERPSGSECSLSHALGYSADVLFCNALLLLQALLVCCAFFCLLGEAKKATSNFKLERKQPLSVRGGVVVGRIWTLANRKAAVFKGIPYADPPLGENRFKKPQNVSNWSGSREALDYGPPCLQFMEFHLNDKYSGANMKRESEDCLYLNVFAPYDDVASGARFPVLFWVHGGSFLAGSADTGIDEEVSLRNIVFKNVILVTINYRLGPFGFLSSSHDEQKGNLGLWDLAQGLQWTKDNILFFGGDPSRVTVMGESAGGAAASILALSPVTSALVQQAIVLSGSSAAGWAIQRGEEPKWSLENLLDYLTCRKKLDPSEIDELYPNASSFTLEKESGCLKLDRPFTCDPGAETSDLWTCMRNEFNLTDPLLRRVLTAELGVSKAVVDNELIPANATYMMQTLPRIPIMTGVAGLEWGHKKAVFYGFRGYADVSERQAREKVQAIMKSSVRDTLYPEKISDSTLELIGNVTFYHYFGRTHPSNKTFNVTEFVDVLRRIETDIEFTTPCLIEAESYAAKGLPVYLYSFDYVPPNGLIEEEQVVVDFFGHKQTIKTTKKRKFKTAFHGLDHAYIFSEGYTSNHQIEFADQDYKLATTMTSLITNFIKNGNPGLDKVTKTKLSWPRFTDSNNTFLRISQDLRLEDNFYLSGTQFWSQLSSQLANYVAMSDEEFAAGSKQALTEDERMQLVAYRKAWWALWLLVAAVAFVLWTVVICIVAKRCIDARSSKPYKNVVVTSS